MCHWMGNIADLFFPLYELMCSKVLESFVLQVDVTAAKYIDPSIKGKAMDGLGLQWRYNAFLCVV